MNCPFQRRRASQHFSKCRGGKRVARLVSRTRAHTRQPPQAAPTAIAGNNGSMVSAAGAPWHACTGRTERTRCATGDSFPFTPRFANATKSGVKPEPRIRSGNPPTMQRNASKMLTLCGWERRLQHDRLHSQSARPINTAASTGPPTLGVTQGIEWRFAVRRASLRTLATHAPEPGSLTPEVTFR